MRHLPPPPIPGQPITANWAQGIHRTLQTLQPIAGAGIRITETENGNILETIPQPITAQTKATTATPRKYDFFAQYAYSEMEGHTIEIQPGKWIHNATELTFNPTGTTEDTETGNVILPVTTQNADVYAIIDDSSDIDPEKTWYFATTPSTYQNAISILIYSQGKQRHVGTIITSLKLEIQDVLGTVNLGANQSSTTPARNLTATTRQVFVPVGSADYTTSTVIFTLKEQQIITNLSLDVQTTYTDLKDEKMDVWTFIPDETTTEGTIARFVDRDANTSTTYQG